MPENRNSGMNASVMSVSQMLRYSIIISVPTSEMAPEMRLVTVEFIMLSMASMSLVKRDISSPVVLASK